jgi:spore coat polysaccharide biosynthesis protein SpsF
MERVQRSSLITRTVVATTTVAEDDVIESLCRREGFAFFRGHPTDLLDRHYRAGLLFRADVVVKIPSDCPLIDPGIIDRVIAFYMLDSGAFDFVSNLHPPSYPDGNDVEVIPMHILKEAWEKAEREFEREHTTPFIWDNPDRFRIGNVAWESGLDYSMSHRWVLDYEEDYQFMRKVYEELYPEKPAFGMDDILRLLEQNPYIQEIWAAISLGANFVERHVTLDRSMWGTDQAASVEILGMYRLVKDIRDIEKAMGDGIKRVYPSEMSVREKLRRQPRETETCLG